MRHFIPFTGRTVFLALLATAFGVSFAGVAVASVGNTFLKIPGTMGHWLGDDHKKWIRVDARDWPDVSPKLPTVASGIKTPMIANPPAPHPGSPSRLVIALEKSNPDVSKLMQMCVNKIDIPELIYAEPVGASHLGTEPSPRLPEAFPKYWEYKLRDVTIDDCEVVQGAAEQAFVLNFKDIQWLNYESDGPEDIAVNIRPDEIPDLKPAPESARGKTKAFLITWLGMGTYVSADQCPTMNRMSSRDDYYALVSKEEAAAERAQQGEKGVSYGGLGVSRPFMENRGPHRLNVCQLPGIVPDPGFVEPKSEMALGVNLDGDNGMAKSPAGICKHVKYRSPDGQISGVDNQLFRVLGCVAGYQGKRGYMNQTHNARRADGNIVTLIEVSGIDDEKNDDSVYVTIFYSGDKPIRAASGEMLPNYTFRPSASANFTRFARRLHGKIVNGFVVTDPVEQFEMHNGQGGIIRMAHVQFRLQILPDGKMKGVMAGYMDWRKLASGNSYGEQMFVYTCPGMYYALKRNADGMKDAATGECNGISAAWEIDAIPAFLTPTALKDSQMASAN